MTLAIGKRVRVVKCNSFPEVIGATGEVDEMEARGDYPVCVRFDERVSGWERMVFDPDELELVSEAANVD